MSKTTIYYYIKPSGENPFSEFLDSLEKRQQSKILRTISHISQYGLLSVIPHVKKIAGTSLWEIRILGNDNLRVVYITPYADAVLVLHGFAKKSQKTPMRELEIAMTRFLDWKRRH